MKELRIKRGLIQIGNSKGIIIPNDFLEALTLTNSDQLYITINNKKMIVEKVK